MPRIRRSCAEIACEIGRLIVREMIPSPGLAVDRTISLPCDANLLRMSRAPGSRDEIDPPPSRTALTCSGVGKSEPSIRWTASPVAGPSVEPKSTCRFPANRSISVRRYSLGAPPSPSSSRQAAAPPRRTLWITRAAAGTPATSASASAVRAKKTIAENAWPVSACGSSRFGSWKASGAIGTGPY